MTLNSVHHLYREVLEEKIFVLTAYKAPLFREFGCCAEVFFFLFVRTTFCKVSGFWTCLRFAFGSLAALHSDVLFRILPPTLSET